jgi:hypothetical protein
MSAYIAKKRFEQFHPGDVLKLNDRQAKYLLMSGHINHIDVGTGRDLSLPTEIKFIEEPELELEPLPEETETDASQAKKKAKKT